MLFNSFFSFCCLSFFWCFFSMTLQDFSAKRRKSVTCITMLNTTRHTRQFMTQNVPFTIGKSAKKTMTLSMTPREHLYYSKFWHWNKFVPEISIIVIYGHYCQIYQGYGLFHFWRLCPFSSLAKNLSRF